MHARPDLPGNAIHVVHQVIAVIQVGQRIQVDVLTLQADIQKGEAQSHRDPDQSDAVGGQMDDAAQIYGDQKG